MKNMKIKSMLLLALVAMLLLGSVGGTVAFLVTSTNSVENVFTPANLDTDIVEVVEGNVKKSITVMNNGNVPVYVRVAIIGYYVDDKTGNIVAPWGGTPSYNVEYWERGSDGFYYYKFEVQPGDSTKNLLSSPIAADTTTYPDAHLVITVMHQSIQAEGLPSNVTSAQQAFALADASRGS